MQSHNHSLAINHWSTLVIVLCVFFGIAIAPITASIFLVGLLAGLHNFFEFRYFLARMPVRWGKSKYFYYWAIGGVVILTFIYIALYAFGGWLWHIAKISDALSTWVSVWHIAVMLWILGLYRLSYRFDPNKIWLYISIVCLLSSIVILYPSEWALMIVYTHPCVAIWFLHRQLKRSMPKLLPYFFRVIGGLIVSLPILWAFASWSLLNNLETSIITPLTIAPEAKVIAQHAGESVLSKIPAHILIATHAWLEFCHYMIWIAVLPFIDKRAIPWAMQYLPIYTHRLGFPRLAKALILLGISIILLLWFGFTHSYWLTRDIYFMIAIAHVLVEIPFLIRN